MFASLTRIAPRVAVSEPKDRTFITVLSVVGVFFFFASLARPYVSDDALIYALIGKAIYTKWMLPFTYAFDHKPIFTYYVYGLVALLGPDNIPKYQLLSVVGFAASALLTKKAAGKEGYWLHFLLITGLSSHFLRFSGNTELFFSPMAVLAIFILVRYESASKMILAGLIAGLAFNMNYLAAFSIGPPALYAIFSKPDATPVRARSLFLFGVGFILAFVLVFLPMALTNVGLIGAYFSAQDVFIHAYGAQNIGRPFWKLILAALPLIFLLAICLPCKKQDERLRNAILVVAGSAFLGAFVSHKNFVYYLYPLVVPTVLVWALSTYPKKKLAALASMAVIFLMTAPGVMAEFGPLQYVKTSYDFSTFKKMKSIVGDEKVLSVRAHNSITYFGDVTPAQPFVWPDHAEFIYGPKEDAYFAGYIQRGVKYVLIREDVCTLKVDPLPETCKAVRDRYTQILKFDAPFPFRRALLYKLND